MKILFKLLPVFFLILSCGSSSSVYTELKPDFTIAFGSCSHQQKEQPLWMPILKNQPDVFLWGGDNIYSDTDNAEIMKVAYQEQNNNRDYQKLLDEVPVLGVWDDHDYGLNDGGKEWHFKDKSQQLLLDFMGVSENSPRRRREGVYHSKIFKTEKGNVKVILLDTRYFRDELIKSEAPNKRYEPSEGTVLGTTQWKWLKNELSASNAKFNIILSSIQILSAEHGFETWGNFPSEIEKLKDLIVSSKAKNVILLSGDRHISEFSKTEVKDLSYPLVDFTSSGLTHTYEKFSGEPNQYRVGEVVNDKSFGLLRFDFDKNEVRFEMRGLKNKLQQDYLLEFQ